MDRGTLDQIRQMLRPLVTRIANIAARGTVKLVKDGARQQLVQLGVLAGETIDDAEHFQPFGFSSVPIGGAEAVVIFPNGDRAHGLVVAVADRRYRPVGGEPGEVTVYNHTGAKITLTKDGDIKATPAPGRDVLIDDGSGTTEPVVKRSEFHGHTHLTAGTGAPVPPTSITPTTPQQTALDASFPGTETLKAK